MPLAELRRKRELNSEAYASKFDSLSPSYPQVLNFVFLFHDNQNLFYLKLYGNFFAL